MRRGGERLFPRRCRKFFNWFETLPRKRSMTSPIQSYYTEAGSKQSLLRNCMTPYLNDADVTHLPPKKKPFSGFCISLNRDGIVETQECLHMQNIKEFGRQPSGTVIGLANKSHSSSLGGILVQELEWRMGGGIRAADFTLLLTLYPESAQPTFIDKSDH